MTLLKKASLVAVFSLKRFKSNFKIIDNMSCQYFTVFGAVCFAVSADTINSFTLLCLRNY
jgi:ABC-type arginine transport system permease subunit